MAQERVAEVSDDDLRELLASVMRNSRKPLEDRVVFLLSYKAGLRAQEIAGLDWWRHILDASGDIRTVRHHTVGAKGRVKREQIPSLQITSDIGKKDNERVIPLHPQLEDALRELMADAPLDGFVVPSRYNTSPDLKRRANALRMRIKRLYEGFLGASKARGYTSHVGRRTFITRACRQANLHHSHLGDVQRLAGHRHLNTTERYMATSPGAADLVRNI